MASSLALKRFLSSPLLARSLLRPAPAASRSFNTNAMRHYDDPHLSSSPSRDNFFSSPTSTPLTLTQVLNMMDHFLDNPFLSASRGIGAGVRRGWDARETEDALLLRIDMPGLAKEHVNISVQNNTLTIKAEGDDQDDDTSARRYTSRIDLPDNLYKLDHIKAEMKNGVLKVLVPKLKEDQRKDAINVRVQ